MSNDYGLCDEKRSQVATRLDTGDMDNESKSEERQKVRLESELKEKSKHGGTSIPNIVAMATQCPKVI